MDNFDQFPGKQPDTVTDENQQQIQRSLKLKKAESMTEKREDGRDDEVPA